MRSIDTGIIISGYGGQGILFAGSLLCHAAVIEGKHTTWIPSYGAEMRGGSANCSVHISDDEVSSPIVNLSDIIFAFNAPSVQKFEKRVKAGGIFIVNSSLADIKPSRIDIEYLLIPLNEINEKINAPLLINMTAIGAFTERTKILKPESIIQAMKELVSQKRAHLLDANIASFQAGVQFVKNMQRALV